MNKLLLLYQRTHTHTKRLYLQRTKRETHSKVVLYKFSLKFMNFNQ